VPTVGYSRFVRRVWDTLAQRTGHEPAYLDKSSIATYCPACIDGTMHVRFVEHPRPSAVISSQTGGAGRCSQGCTEDLIAEALFK
jgi:hypothetical protein